MHQASYRTTSYAASAVVCYSLPFWTLPFGEQAAAVLVQPHQSQVVVMLVDIYFK